MRQSNSSNFLNCKFTCCKTMRLGSPKRQSGTEFRISVSMVFAEQGKNSLTGKRFKFEGSCEMTAVGCHVKIPSQISMSIPLVHCNNTMSRTRFEWKFSNCNVSFFQELIAICLSRPGNKHVVSPKNDLSHLC